MIARGRGERGFTLIELMVVVALISILVAVAMPWLKNSDDVDANARSIAGLVGSAAQLAVSRGPVPAAIVDAEGGDTSRVRVRIVNATGTVQIAVVELRVEVDDVSSAWEEVGSYHIARGAEVIGSEAFANLDGGGLPSAGDIVIGCNTDGQCTPTTIYLRQRGADRNRVRVIVLPLSQSPVVRDDW